ncbi:ABC transporter substrate-binding protein [Fusicatenibacter saccharivorans]|jgi:peptide/nickel transport system substrate-binding protein|uniref:ABC transporter substrate-binding protein n=1 Tax=Fusicatenibacter saccharivorans TaxID=1150298 RepID=UPI0022E5F437|nr:ABC transporter substrate-binding protein [Fusicatenibacter saccharivorans]
MKKEIVSVMMAACLFASFATGCGTANESETSSKSGSEAASVTSASEEAAGAVSKSGETTTDGERADLVLGATTGFFGAESLDVAYNWDGWIMSIYGISENLYRLDENIEPQPWIAESVETPDENTWVFTIRDGVTFSNGKTVDAKAVKACFERTYEKNERADSTLKIKSMEADGMKFTIVTPEPNPTLLNDLCDPLLGIYDATEEPDEELGVSCTGPYVATSFTAMTDVKMRANENYWGGAPKADTVELKIIDDQDALDMALANGEIDLIAQETANGASKFTDTSKYTTDTVTTTRANFLSFNLKTEGLDDLAVRQAINYCIDREGYADVVYQGFATPCYGIYPDNLAFGGTDGLNLTVDSYDADKAKEILADAGYQDTDGDGILDKDGVNLSFKVLTYSYNDNCIQLADMLQAELSQIGIELSIETQDVLDDPLASGDFDLAILNYAMAPIGTPSYFINMLFTTGASNNYGGYSNEKVDALAAEIGTTSDNDKVVSLTRELEQQVLDDMPFAFVADQQLIFVYSNKVKGVQINPTEYYLVTNTLSVEE